MSESKLVRIARVSRPYRFALIVLVAVVLSARWVLAPNVAVITTQKLREVWPASTFHTGDLIVDNSTTTTKLLAGSASVTGSAFVGSGLNIGSSSGSDALDVRGSASQVTIETTSSPTNKLLIHNSGITIWDFDPIPGAGTDAQSVRFFRHTVTSGLKDICITAGNASSCNTDLVGTVRGGTTQSQFANGLALVSALMIVTPTNVTFDHGTGASGGTASAGLVTSVGATTVTMTTAPLLTITKAYCAATPTSTSPQTTVMTAAFVSSTAVLFSCFATTTGAAANCPDFNYVCFYGT